MNHDWASTALNAASRALSSALSELEYCIEEPGRDADPECTCAYCECWFAELEVKAALVAMKNPAVTQ